MTNSSPDNFSSVSIDKNNKIIGLRIQKEGLWILHIQDNPDNIRVLSAFILMAIVSVGLFFLAGSRALITYHEVLGLSLFFVFLFVLGATKELRDMRSIYCVVNKQTRWFHYSRGGLFGLQHDAQNASGNISDILQLEIKRHSERGEDKFQIIFLLRNNTKLILSGRNLGFSECQKFTETIRDFIDSELHIKAVD